MFTASGAFAGAAARACLGTICLVRLIAGKVTDGDAGTVATGVTVGIAAWKTIPAPVAPLPVGACAKKSPALNSSTVALTAAIT